MTLEQVASSPMIGLAAAVVLLAAVVMGRRLELKVGKIHAELRPNGGSSYHDQAEERAQNRHKTFREEVTGMISAMDERLTDLDGRVSRLEGEYGKAGDRRPE